MIERPYRRGDHLGPRAFCTTVAELVLCQLTRRMTGGRCAVCATRLLVDDPLGLIDGRLAHADCVVTDWLGCGLVEYKPRVTAARTEPPLWLRRYAGHSDDADGCRRSAGRAHA